MQVGQLRRQLDVKFLSMWYYIQPDSCYINQEKQFGYELV